MNGDPRTPIRFAMLNADESRVVLLMLKSMEYDYGLEEEQKQLMDKLTTMFPEALVPA